MLSFKNYIEAFTDPDSKETFHWDKRGEFLKKYKNRKDIFVTFHNIPKFGLNPNNKYNTPTALYSYPINYVIDYWDGENKNFDLPFAANSEYFSVFQHVKNKLIQITDDGRKITNKDKAQEKLDEFIFNFIKEYYNTDLKAYKKHYLRVQFNVDIKYILSEFYMLLNNLSKSHIITPTQINNFKQEIGKIILESVDKKFPYEDDIKPAWNDENEFLKDKKDLLTGNADIYTHDKAKLKNDSAFPWVMLLIKAKNPNNFNAICRKLGIAGFQDHGTGTIHENEPTSAAFFNINDLKIIPPSPIINTKPKTDVSHQPTNWTSSFTNGMLRLKWHLDKITSKLPLQKQNLLIKNSIRKNKFPNDEVLFHWLEFCAKQGLYKEGVIIYNKINKSNKNEEELFFINKFGNICIERSKSNTFSSDDFETSINSTASKIIGILETKPKEIEINEDEPLININTLREIIQNLIKYESYYPVFTKLKDKLNKIYYFLQKS